jgi:hypothetical protein
MMDQGEQEAELGSQRKRPVEIRGNRAALAGDRRNGGKQIAGKCSDLKPSCPRILAAANRQYQCPRKADNDDKQKQREKRPPDFSIEHGRRL